MADESMTYENFTVAGVKALGMGINLTVLHAAIPKLEAACNHKIEASEDFKNVVEVAAIESGIIPGVLAQYIKARCSDTVKKKAQSAGQLSLLFEEIQ